MARYVAELLDSQGYPRLGTSGVMVGNYQSDRNALRYMPIRLRNGVWPAGQYQVLKIDRNPEILVGHIYKTPPTNRVVCKNRWPS